MASVHPHNGASDDPRRLRELLERSIELVRYHGVRTVIVGVAGPEGDVLLPDMFDYLESSLRVEDSVFRMTRERAVLFLADVHRAEAEGVMSRFVIGFRERFPSVSPPDLQLGYFELGPNQDSVQVREVLPAIFPSRAATAH